MATLVTLSSGRKLLQITLHGERRSISIGRARNAGTIKGHVEELKQHAESAQPLTNSTRGWVADLAKHRGRLFLRLVELKLVRDDAPKPVQPVPLRPFFDKYIRRLTSPATFEQLRNSLAKHFGDDADLRAIDRAGVMEWHRAAKERYAAATVAGFVKKARTVWREAMAQGAATSNPFKEIKAGRMSNPERQRYVSRETVLKVIEACPDAEWELIFALARFGGLRTPSETFTLRWENIDFSKGRMKVYAPKTKTTRVVPILADLLPFLKDAEKFMVGGGGSVIKIHLGDNLRTQAERIIEDAGVTRWPRLFQNLRSSFETDMATIVPIHVACSWTGNSEAVAIEHYLQVTDEHFEKARAAKTSASGLLRIEGGAHPTLKIGQMKGFADMKLPSVGTAQSRKFRAFLKAHARAAAKAQRLIELMLKERRAALAVGLRAVGAVKREQRSTRRSDISTLSRRIAAVRPPLPDPTEAR